MSFLYDYGREGFLAGDLDWDAQTFRVCLIDTGMYTVDATGHENMDDVTEGWVGYTPGSDTQVYYDELTNASTTGGVADAADCVLTSVSGTGAEAMIIYQNNSGGLASCRLVAYINSATGLPITPNGGNINIQWDNAANKIFKL